MVATKRNLLGLLPDVMLFFCVLCFVYYFVVPVGQSATRPTLMEILNSDTEPTYESIQRSSTAGSRDVLPSQSLDTIQEEEKKFEESEEKDEVVCENVAVLKDNDLLFCTDTSVSNPNWEEDLEREKAIYNLKHKKKLRKLVQKGSMYGYDATIEGGETERFSGLQMQREENEKKS